MWNCVKKTPTSNGFALWALKLSRRTFGYFKMLAPRKQLRMLWTVWRGNFNRDNEKKSGRPSFAKNGCPGKLDNNYCPIKQRVRCYSTPSKIFLDKKPDFCPNGLKEKSGFIMKKQCPEDIDYLNKVLLQFSQRGTKLRTRFYWLLMEWDKIVR